MSTLVEVRVSFILPFEKGLAQMKSVVEAAAKQ